VDIHRNIERELSYTGLHCYTPFFIYRTAGSPHPSLQCDGTLCYKNQTATPEIEKDDIDIGDLDEYISTKAYPNATFFKEDLKKLQTNEERQKKVQELMKGRVADYLQNAEQNKETFNFKDVEDVKALKSALEKGD
jgi:hypothetical protein